MLSAVSKNYSTSINIIKYNSLFLFLGVCTTSILLSFLILATLDHKMNSKFSTDFERKDELVNQHPPKENLTKHDCCKNTNNCS